MLLNAEGSIETDLYILLFFHFICSLLILTLKLVSRYSPKWVYNSNCSCSMVNIFKLGSAPSISHTKNYLNHFVCMVYHGITLCSLINWGHNHAALSSGWWAQVKCYSLCHQKSDNPTLRYGIREANFNQPKLYYIPEINR